MKKLIVITIMLSILLISCGCQADVSEDNPQSSTIKNEIDEPSDSKENIPTDNMIESTLPDEFKAVDSTLMNADDYAEALRLSEATIDQYLKTIYKAQEPAFSELIYSDNLRTYLEEKVKISIDQRESISDSSDIRVDSVEVLESELYDTYYFFKLQYSHGGGYSVCYTLVTNDGGILKVADIYFLMKDGFDIYATGDVKLERTFDNPEIWTDDDWYKKVMDRLSDYKIGSAMYSY